MKYILMTMILFFILSCKKKEMPETYLAKVGDQVLTFEEMVERYPQPANQGQSLRKEVIDQWIEHQLLYQEALARQIDKNTVVQKKMGNSVQDILVNELLMQISSLIRVEESEMSNYYQQHATEFTRNDDEVRLIHISYTNSSKTEKAFAKVKNVKDLQDFLATASDVPLSEVNPDMGYLALSDLLPELSSAANKLKIGQLSRPIHLGESIHFVGLLDRRNRGSEKSFDQVKEDIRERIFIQKQKQAFQQFIESLKKKYPITIYLPTTPESPDTTRG